MYVMATFEHSAYLELALSALEMEGVPKEDILTVPLNNRTEKRKLFDTIHRSDGISLFDLGAALATAFSVIGASIGFRLAWGPIVWGVMGALIGLALGILISVLLNTKKRQKQRKLRGKTSELIVIIHCDHQQIENIEEILWDNLALGVAKLDNTFVQS